MRARYERYDKHGKNGVSSCSVFWELPCRLHTPCVLFLVTPEKPPATARLTSARTDAITGKAERMKMRRDHLVPLSRQASTVLEKLRTYSDGNQYVFPSYRSETIPFEKTILSRAIRRMGFEEDEMCPHGFRAMASTLLNELGYNRDWIERQLAHAPTDQIHRIKTGPNTCPNAAVCFMGRLS